MIEGAERELQFKSHPSHGWEPCDGVKGVSLCPFTVTSELGYKPVPNRVIAIRASRLISEKRRGMWITIDSRYQLDSFNLAGDDNEFVKTVTKEQFEALGIEPRLYDRWWITARLVKKKKTEKEQE